MRFNKRLFMWAGVFILLLSTTRSKADFTQVLDPDVVYTSSTTLIDIATISDGSVVGSISDGTQTVTLSANLTKWTVPVPLAYSFWGPAGTERESSAPPTLQSATTLTSLTMDLALASNTFGFELLGNPGTPGISTFTLNFYENTNLVGSFSRNIDSDQNNAGAGALLMAATSFSNPFTRVVLTAPLSANGFSIAQVRYNVVPEPASIAMMAQAVGVAGFYMWRRRRRTSPMD
jgi:hypothetical protein